ncbi:MAG: hypothetical protein SFZ24_00985 [Planctomycetota bacterium]|nr:hypothetical protein [Planctomycetota bacterium]
MNCRTVWGPVALAMVASAAAGQVVYVPVFPFKGDAPFDNCGYSVSGAGDVNNDGFEDFIVGIPGTGFADFGSARVVSGATGAILYTFNGGAVEDFLGISVSGAGDVNGDGFDDVIVGAPYHSSNGYAVGRALVFSGATGAILYTFNGDAALDFFGWSVSGAGDVNNDGFDDVIVGSYPDAAFPTARVFSGATGQLLYSFGGEFSFGWSVSDAGDVNNDGFDDVVVGAPQSFNNGPFSGTVRVFSGSTGGVLYAFNGDSAGDYFGYSVSGAGDVNNDGFDDLIVGAWLDDNNGVDSGSAQVFSGATGAVLHTFNGDSEFDNFGFSVSGAGDVNNDGFDDVIVGAILDDNNGTDSGSARVFSGATGAVLHTFNGDSAEDYFGWSVSGVGDVNNDGFDDLIVGAQQDDSNGTDSGSATFFFSAAAFSWGTALPPACPGDANGDRSVNFADVVDVLRNFNATCP